MSDKNEQQIRSLLDRWIQASSNKDLDAIMACYTPDVRAFDAIVQLQFVGSDAYRKHWETCIGFMPGEMKFGTHQLEIATGDDVAFCHYLISCGFTDEDGKDQSSWSRGTVCLRKLDGEWKIAHEHFSFPFDPESNQALTELEP